MLFSLLFDNREQLIAAAPALYQYPVGDSYWTEVYAGDVSVDGGCQTAHVQIEDRDLVEKLSSLEFDDQHLAECRRRVEEITGTLSTNMANRRAA